MRLCNSCKKIVGNYTKLCRGCKPKKIKEIKIPKKIFNKIPKVYKIYNLSHKERYGFVKTGMPKQITLNRDDIGNII